MWAYEKKKEILTITTTKCVFIKTKQASMQKKMLYMLIGQRVVQHSSFCRLCDVMFLTDS